MWFKMNRKIIVLLSFIFQRFHYQGAFIYKEKSLDSKGYVFCHKVYRDFGIFLILIERVNFLRGAKDVSKIIERGKKGTDS